MFVTIMKTARTSDLRRGHRTAGFVPELRVGSFLRNDSADCTIVTIDGLVRIDLPPVLIYMCAPRALGFVPSRVFRLYRGDNRIRDYSTKNRRVSGPGSSFGEPHAKEVSKFHLRLSSSVIATHRILLQGP